MTTPNKYANIKPSDQQNTSGQRRQRREEEQHQQRARQLEELLRAETETESE